MLNNPDTVIGSIPDRKKGGSVLEPIPEPLGMCQDPQHMPLSHTYIPPGMQLRHTCPSCGHETIIRPMNITF